VMENRDDKKRHFLLNVAFWAMILAVVYFVFKYLLNLLMPFFLALIFAAVSRPMARYLSADVRWKKGENGEKIPVKRRFRLRSSVAGVVSVLLLFLVLGVLLILLLVRLTDGIVSLASAIPHFYSNSILPGFTALLHQVELFASRFDDSILEAVQATIPNLIASVGSAVTSFSAAVVSRITSLAGQLPTMLLNVIICMIATVFISVDFETISGFIRRNLPSRAMSLVTDIRDSFLDIIWQFLRSYFTIFCITAAEVSLGLFIIGMNKPVLLGFIVATFDAFPIVGSGMILLPWAIITLFSGTLWRGLGLLLLYVVVVVARQIIEPKIVGKHVGLRPLVTLICMFVGTRLFGALGLFGLPIMAAIINDLNSSGLIHLFKNPEPEKAAESEEGAV